MANDHQLPSDYRFDDRFSSYAWYAAENEARAEQWIKGIQAAETRI